MKPKQLVSKPIDELIQEEQGALVKIKCTLLLPPPPSMEPPANYAVFTHRITHRTRPDSVTA